MSGPISLGDVRKAMPYCQSGALEKLKIKLQDSLKPKAQMAREQRSRFITRFVIAGFLGGGGVFILLAAHQVLPHGMNAMSQLRPWSQIAGYGLIAVCLGSLITPTKFAYLSWSDLQKEKKIREKEFNQEVDALTKEVIKADLTLTEMLEVTEQKEGRNPTILLFVKGAVYPRPAGMPYDLWAQSCDHSTGKTYAQIFADKHMVQLGNLNIRWMPEVQRQGARTIAQAVEIIRTEIFG